MINEVKRLFGSDFSRVKNNSKAYLIEFLSVTVLKLLIIPIMIKAWGLNTYGVWIFLMSIPLTLSLVNIDIIDATRQELTLKHNKSTKFLSNLFSNSIACTFLNLLIFGALYFSIYFLFFDNLKVLDNYDYNNFKLLTVIVYFGICFDTLARNVLVVFDCSGLTRKTTLISNNFYIFQTLAIAFIAFLTDDLFLPVMIFFILSLVKLIYSSFIIPKEKIILLFHLVKITEIKKIYFLSKSYYLNNLIGIIYISGFNSLVGIFYSAESVALVNSLNTLFRWSISRATHVLIMPLNYEYANHFKNKRYTKLKKIFNYQFKLLLSILFLYFLGSILFGEFLFNIWTLHKFDEFKILLFLIILENSVYILGNNYLFCLKSINKFYNLSKIDFFLSLFILFVIYLLAFYSFSIETLICILLLRSFFALILSRYFYKQQKMIN